ncbi:aspartate aminotransferase family protein [Pectinatus frisingensis]|uniref:aspartate aminotransferase family protein n=1 Tax=Pectinatus frisingensis TaxID=865 RepID=UPI0015F4D40B|nr:aspartate aminotransferase family protein [Pectinatus frisingensis]
MLKDDLPKIVTSHLPGPKSASVINRRNEAIPSAIRCGYPVVIKRGAGAIIEDLDGNRFLDFIGGVGVLNIGFSHPEVIAAVKKQAENYFHGMFNVITHEGYVKLAETINSLAPVKGNKKRTFFANSGAEADENAVKIAKAFTKRPNIIVFSGAFHGRTLLTMSMTAKKSYARGMGPFPDGVYRAEFPYLYRRPDGMPKEKAIDYYVEKLYETFRNCSDPEYVAAIVVEPLQGEGGFIPAPIEWVQAIRKICDKYSILLVADEVQCGFCRTGRIFATEYWCEAGVQPDIITMAKSIAAGIPLSGIVARDEIMQAVPAGIIGGTYCGNPLACAAALKVIEIMQRDNLAQRSIEIGKKVITRYAEWLKKYDAIGDIRGLGGMIGIEFVKSKYSKEPAGELVNELIAEAVQHGLLLESAGIYNNVIRFLAPLVITDEQLDTGLDIFEAAIEKCVGRRNI